MTFKEICYNFAILIIKAVLIFSVFTHKKAVQIEIIVKYGLAIP